jgi:hypothetical protein
VDYWNHLGWADPFSSVSFSRRQREYASALGLGSLYTPQMIVNGSTEFVGSDRARARHEIATALARNPRVTIALEVARDGAMEVVGYRVQGAPPEAMLRVVTVESKRVSRVRAGENAGRTLSHFHVVRELVSVPLSGGPAGSVRLSRVAESGGPPRVVAFVQDPHSLAILGAAGAPAP